MDGIHGIDSELERLSQNGMVEIIHAERRSAVLSPSALPCLSRIPTVNLTAGCAHGCLYCYARSYKCYPGEGKVIIYSNAFQKLRDEFARKRSKPRTVYFSPSSDLFQPVPEVLDMAYKVLEFLFRRQVGVAFLTKGRIPERHMALLQANAPDVHAQIGILTLDRELLALFEPNAPPPSVRLAQIRALLRSGITTEARVDPILPGISDSGETLGPLCSELASIGVKQMAASTLFLRPAVTRSLRKNLSHRRLRAVLLSQFREREAAEQAGRPSVRALPAAVRKGIYERLRRIAALHGIALRVCACENPDLPSQYCGIAGEWAGSPTKPSHQDLFGGIERE